MIGGVIPPRDHDELYKDGVMAIFAPGTALPAASCAVLKAIGGGGAHLLLAVASPHPHDRPLEPANLVRSTAEGSPAVAFARWGGRR